MSRFQHLIIDQTPNSPMVNLDQLTGELIISGKSIPENATKLYVPVLDWISEYILNPKPVTNLRLDLEYFNTASSIWIAKILNLLVHIDNPDYVLIVHLYFSAEEFDEINEFEDIDEAFSPVTNIFRDAIANIGLKLYGRDKSGEIVKEALVFIESGQVQTPSEIHHIG